MDVTAASVLIPYDWGDCHHRRSAFNWVWDHYDTHHSTWELIQGYGSMRPWSKGAAVHSAFERCTGDTLVIADADSFVKPELLEECVAQVTQTRRWAVPHGMIFRLDREHTEKLYAGWTIPRTLRWQQLARPAYNAVPGGGITVVHREAYEAVGGIDPRFLGWGGEDIAFGWALHALVGLPHWPRGNLYHLWHPHALGDKADTLRGSAESEALVAEYKAARRSPERMREVIARWTQPA